MSEADRAALEEIVKKGQDWRKRHRAQTLLYFSEGCSAKDIATRQDLHLDTVYDRRKHWLKDGFASLADRQRSGAPPPKVNETQSEQLRAWVSTDALTARDLVSRVKEEFDIAIHPNTLGTMLKRMDFVWKRTRHGLKKRNQLKFRQAQSEIEDLLVQADKGEITLAYCDEVGFAPAHPIRSAWIPIGKCHTSDARRCKRLNVIGALLSSGELFTVKLWETMTAALFVAFLGLLMEHVGKPLVVILDNDVQEILTGFGKSYFFDFCR